MSTLYQTISCYVLAGGKSSRMGQDKGLIQVNKKFLVEYVLEIVKPIFKDIVLVSKNIEYDQFGLERIQDVIQDVGPAGGIYTALLHAKTDKILVISCDMPSVNSKAIEFLIDTSEKHEIVVPIHDKKFEPLLAIYSKSCLDTWKKELDKGVFKLQNIISNFKVLELDVTNQKQFPKELFTNINTKEDLERLVLKLKDGN